jgi:hypothetical protein
MKYIEPHYREYDQSLPVDDDSSGEVILIHIITFPQFIHSYLPYSSTDRKCSGFILTYWMNCIEHDKKRIIIYLTIDIHYMKPTNVVLLMILVQSLHNGSVMDLYTLIW